MTRLDEDVFYPVLVQMKTPGVGYVNIEESKFILKFSKRKDFYCSFGAARIYHYHLYTDPIDCDGDEVCHLAWLVRDHPDLLENDHLYGHCSNGTNLKDLNATALQDCL